MATTELTNLKLEEYHERVRLCKQTEQTIKNKKLCLSVDILAAGSMIFILTVIAFFANQSSSGAETIALTTIIGAIFLMYVSWEANNDSLTLSCVKRDFKIECAKLKELQKELFGSELTTDTEKELDTIFVDDKHWKPRD